MINQRTARFLTREVVDKWEHESKEDEMFRNKIIELLEEGNMILMDDKGILQMVNTLTKH